ncbi:MAG: DUF2207 domain-containing protein [Desulforegulaceae bacterium]|nr:DUF2207 domain-containing protein [Desulforegulaceae bacterium]
MYIKKILLSTALFFIIFSSSFLSAEDFTIKNYQVDMVVHENNSYDIVETIDVYFLRERHGIFRNLPRYFDSNPIKITNISVDGFKKTITKTNTDLIIKIGSADTYVNGNLRYIISYTYNVGKDFLPDMDEFYHNLIGTQWDTSIEAASFVIKLPKAFNANDVNCTSGVYGSKDNSNVKWEVKNNTITGKILKPLNKNEGLTIALPLPESYWVDAVKHRESGWLFFTVFGYPLYILVIILSFILWYLKGRDTKLFPSVQFEPPEGMTPSEIGYVIDGVVDDKDVTSLILYWADKGFLEIEEVKSGFMSKKTLELIKIAEPGPDARDYERHIFKKLFSNSTDGRVSTKDLTDSFYKTISWAQSAITENFTRNKETAIC